MSFAARSHAGLLVFVPTVKNMASLLPEPETATTITTFVSIRL